MIKNLIRKFVYGYKSDSESFIKKARKMGMRIGEGCFIIQPYKTSIDETRPYLIDIGNNVKIASGVTILTHGFDWCVFNEKYGDVLGSAGKVKIGNNVFIGAHSTILKGVTIGDNVIIGANSLVIHDIPSDSVAAGNPARVITDLESYHRKRIALQKEEAKEIALEWRKVYGSMQPPKEVFHEFFWLFDGEYDGNKFINDKYEEMMHINGNYEKAMKTYHQTKKCFNSYHDFLEWCYADKNQEK